MQAAAEPGRARGCSRRSARGRPRPRRAGPGPRRVRARGCAACTSGCRPARIRATGSRIWRTAEANAATRTVPAGAADGSRSRRAASIAARTVTAWPASRRPAGVSRTRRPSGSVSGVPASRARAAICWETVEVVTCIASPTSRIEPRRDSSSSSSRRRGSRSESFIIHEQYVHETHVDTDDLARMYWHHDRHRDSAPVPGPGRHLDGRGLDDLRPARPGAVGPAVRPGRPAGGGLAAAGLGGSDPAGRRPAPALAVPAPGRCSRRSPSAW